ncbi:MAG TPA: sulfotransferase domain-containing protein [Dongiaceae bacterium]|nr:sulfotransferase domain-containing protein [Dongiaceae bacterium]
MIDSVMNRVVREIVERAAMLAPPQQRCVIRRRARGREDARNLRQADLVFVSHGKSGRTWLRVMLSRFFQIRFDLPEDCLLSFDNLHGMNRAVPRILFTHDNYIRDYTGTGSRKTAFYDKPTVLLVRHPGDVAVSQYFQWRHRMPPYKKELNAYPPHGSEVSIFDFVMHEEAGLRRVVRFMNEWAEELPRIESHLMVRYEDMRADCRAEFRRILTWMGQYPAQAEVDQSVEFASFDNLREMEARRAFKSSGKRMAPGDEHDPDSYKVRRAKVGGYRDYFDDDEVRQIDSCIGAHLDPLFGYEAGDGRRVAV